MESPEDKWGWIGELHDLVSEMRTGQLIKLVEYARSFVNEKEAD